MNYLPELLALIQILLIDLAMSGENVLVVGMAAAGLPEAKRHQAVYAGIGGAAILRIIFAFFAVQLLKITGLLVAGGLLLMWVAWKMGRELVHFNKKRHAKVVDSEAKAEIPAHPAPTLAAAITQIIVADVSMSLDNVLAVAGVARYHFWIMVVGLMMSVVLMGVAATFVAKFAARHNWIGYVALLVVLFAALKMVWDGAQPFLT